jgi:hypothetical protein
MPLKELVEDLLADTDGVWEEFRKTPNVVIDEYGLTAEERTLVDEGTAQEVADYLGIVDPRAKFLIVW